jgi:hypothetical protein
MSTTTSTSRPEVLGVALALVFALSACAPYPTHRAVTVDCSVTNGYTFKKIDNFEGESNPNFFASADSTPGAVLSVALAQPPGGVACDGTTALEVVSSGNDDWGSLTGYSNFGPQDASQYEGLSFWAMTGPVSGKALTILFDDPNTYNNNTNMMPSPPTANCTQYAKADGGTQPPPQNNTDPSTGMPISSGTATAPPPMNACGNEYQTSGFTVTGAWKFYTIPFGSFHQTPDPNVVPNAELATVGNMFPATSLITSRLMTFVLRFPKAVETDLWLDDVAFYAHQGWMPPGSDAGAGQ